MSLAMKVSAPMSRYDDAFEEDRGDFDPPRRRRRREFEDDDRAAADDRPLVKPRQSGLGIASFFLAIIAGFSVAGLLIFIGIVSINGPPPDDAPEMIVSGLGLIGSGLLALIGMTLGFAGC